MKSKTYINVCKCFFAVVLLSDGPENLEIKGDKRAILGQAVQINCSLSSVPAPTFAWMFNDTVLLGETRQCITISSFDNKNSGVYTCEAFNNVTGLRRTVKHNLTVKGKKAHKSVLSLNPCSAGVSYRQDLFCCFMCRHKRARLRRSV